MHHLKIFAQDPVGYKTRVFLDGHELNGVRSVTATVSATDIQQVTLVLEAKVDWETSDWASLVANEASTDV